MPIDADQCNLLTLTVTGNLVHSSKPDHPDDENE